MKEFIEFGLVGFLIYLVFNRYILPIFRFTTVASSNVRKMKEKMQEMEQQMNQHNNAGQYRTQQKKTVEKEGDYIDYEEVK